MRLRQRRTRRCHQLHVTDERICWGRLPADFAGPRLVQLSATDLGLYTRLEEDGRLT